MMPDSNKKRVRQSPLSEATTPELPQLPWHLTASAVVLAQGHILLVHHRRIAAWLPPGGHIDEGELPHQAALREVFEETGVQVRVLSSPVPNTADAEAFFLPQPLCMHAVHAVERGQPLYHVDIAFLCVPHPMTQSESSPGSALPPIQYTSEVHEARWVSLQELDRLPLARNVRELVDLLEGRYEGLL